jgi:hypothetical protein
MEWAKESLKLFTRSSPEPSKSTAFKFFKVYYAYKLHFNSNPLHIFGINRIIWDMKCALPVRSVMYVFLENFVDQDRTPDRKKIFHSFFEDESAQILQNSFKKILSNSLELPRVLDWLCVFAILTVSPQLVDLKTYHRLEVILSKSDLQHEVSSLRVLFLIKLKRIRYDQDITITVKAYDKLLETANNLNILGEFYSNSSEYCNRLFSKETENFDEFLLDSTLNLILNPKLVRIEELRVQICNQIKDRSVADFVKLANKLLWSSPDGDEEYEIVKIQYMRCFERKWEDFDQFEIALNKLMAAGHLILTAERVILITRTKKNCEKLSSEEIASEKLKAKVEMFHEIYCSKNEQKLAGKEIKQDERKKKVKKKRKPYIRWFIGLTVLTVLISYINWKYF